MRKICHSVPFANSHALNRAQLDVLGERCARQVLCTDRGCARVSVYKIATQIGNPPIGDFETVSVVRLSVGMRGNELTVPRSRHTQFSLRTKPFGRSPSYL